MVFDDVVEFGLVIGSGVKVDGCVVVCVLYVYVCIVFDMCLMNGCLDV